MRFTILLVACLPLAAQDWKLGSAQTSLIVGANLSEMRGWGSPQPSVGAGFNVGLFRYAALTSSYTWNRFGGASSESWVRDTLIRVSARAAQHDLLGGIRFHAPIGRVTPYAGPVAGIVIATANAELAGVKSSSSLTELAAGAGAGMEIRLGAGFSFLTDVKVIRPREMTWYGHVGFGFAYRTPKPQ